MGGVWDRQVAEVEAELPRSPSSAASGGGAADTDRLRALFGQMERTYTLERAAHARAVATAKGRRIGRPPVVDEDKLAYAAHLRDTGHSIAEIVAKSGIARTSLYRHLPPRPAEQLTEAPTSEQR